MQTVPIATPQIKAGKVKALAVTSPQPSALAPGLPTVAATLPGFEAQSLLGVVAPTGTPGPVVSQIHQDIARAVRGAEVRERIIALGAQPVGNAPEEFTAVLKMAIGRLDKLIRQTGLQLD